MSTKMEVANRDFADKLAQYASKKVIEPRVLTANKNEAKEQAVQSAIAYWTLGWHWDEIASILEDSGFVEGDIDYAVKKAQGDVQAKLRNGPFSILQHGQLVKLVSGGYGKLVDKREDFVVLETDGAKLSVMAKHIDFEKTSSLGQAFSLRKDATEYLRKLGQENINPDDLGKATKINIKPDPTEKGVGHRWPVGVPDVDPETGELTRIEDVEYAHEVLDSALMGAINQIMDLSREIEQESAVIKKEKEELALAIKPVEDSLRAHEVDIAKMVDDVLNNIEQTGDVAQQQYTYVMNFLNRLLILDQHVAELKVKKEMTSVPEYRRFYEGLINWSETQPTRIKNKMLKAIAEVEEAAIIQPKPMWQRVFSIIWPTERRRKLSQDQGMLSKIMDAAGAWLRNSFAAVQKYFDSWNNDIKPDIEEQTAQVDAFIEQAEALEQAGDAKAAVASILNHCKK